MSALMVEVDSSGVELARIAPTTRTCSRAPQCHAYPVRYRPTDPSRRPCQPKVGSGGFLASCCTTATRGDRDWRGASRKSGRLPPCWGLTSFHRPKHELTRERRPSVEQTM